MGFVIDNITNLQVKDLITTYQYQLSEVVNSLTNLGRCSAELVEKQNAMTKYYLSQDSEGIVNIGGKDMAVADYVNSSAFTAPFQAELKRIQLKEQELEQKKLKLETEINKRRTYEEGIEKLQTKNIETTFGYAK